MYKINKSTNALPVTVDKIRLRSIVSKYTFQRFFNTLDELLAIDSFYERPSTSMDYRYQLLIKTRGPEENATVYIGYVAGVIPAENTASAASFVIEFNPNKVDYEHIVFYLLFYFGILDVNSLDKIDILGADIAYDFFNKDITFFKVITLKTVFKHFQNTFGNTKYYGAKKHGQIRLYDKIGGIRYEYDKLLKDRIKDKKERNVAIDKLCEKKYGPEFFKLNHWTRLEVSYKPKNSNLKYIFGDPNEKIHPNDEVAADQAYMNNLQDLYHFGNPNGFTKPIEELATDEAYMARFRDTVNRWEPLNSVLKGKQNSLGGLHAFSKGHRHYSIEETGKLDYTPYISPQEVFQKSNIKLTNPYNGTIDMNFDYPIIGYFEDMASFGITKPADKAFLFSYMHGYMDKSEIPQRNFEKIKEAILSVQSHLQINELFAPFALREYIKTFFKIRTDHFPQERPAGMDLQEYSIPDYSREINKRFKKLYEPASMEQTEINIAWTNNRKEVFSTDFMEYNTSGEAE